MNGWTDLAIFFNLLIIKVTFLSWKRLKSCQESCEFAKVLFYLYELKDSKFIYTKFNEIWTVQRLLDQLVRNINKCYNCAMNIFTL